MFYFKYLTVLLVLLFEIHANAQPNMLKGFVINEEKMPVAGAVIFINNGEQITSSLPNGSFEFSKPATTSYKINVGLAGYSNFERTIMPDSANTILKVVLNSAPLHIDEIQVTANRNNLYKKKESAAVELVSDEFIKSNMAANILQTLNKLPGVSSMDIGSGLSKPIIRGMGYYRVVVAQNGLKMEGQQWSNHHGIAIDQHAIEQIEIVKGPASLRYGSDAIGGVINILPHEILSESGIEAELFVSAKTNNRFIGSSANVSGRTGALFFNSTLTYNNYADFVVPQTDSFLLPAPVSAIEASHKVKMGKYVLNTSGNEKAFSLCAGLTKKWGNSSLDFSYFVSNSGFFDWEGYKSDSIRYQHEKNLGDILQPSQSIKNITLNHFTNVFFHKSKLEIALGYQHNNAAEYSYLINRTGNRAAALAYFRSKGNLDLLLLQNTCNAHLTYISSTIEKHTLSFGMAGQYQNNSKDGYNHILPDYSRQSIGLYGLHKYRFSENLILNSALRSDFGMFKMEETLNPDPQFGDTIFNNQFSKNFIALAFSAGAIYLLTGEKTFKANIGRSFRMPSAYELGAYGLHRHEGRLEKGDTLNQPEQAWQLDLGFEHIAHLFEYSISPFVTWFSNYLYLNPTSELRPEGQVYEYKQCKAMLLGGETLLKFKFTKSLLLLFSAEYVYAVNLTMKSALPFTPPFKACADLEYTIGNYKALNNSKLSIEYNWLAAQNYTVPNELSTEGYTLMGILAKTTVSIASQPVNFTFKVRNLLNTRYFNHVSFYRRLRIPEPGRSFELSISIPFKSNSNKN